jgi:uncharacterized membrane protein
VSDGIRVYSAGPLSVIAIIIIIGLLLLIVPLLFLGLAGAAFTRLGFPWIASVAFVLLMILGSFISIPIGKIRRDTIRLAPSEEVPFDNHAVPSADSSIWGTVVSLNLGGAVIPLALSCYLFYRSYPIIGSALPVSVGIGIFVVAVVSYVTTRPQKGYGLRSPFFMPGLTALLAGLLISGGAGLSAGVIAFISGTAGTLLGANVAHIRDFRDLEVPDVSIGGTGTFAAIFISCILATLIA